MGGRIGTGRPREPIDLIIAKGKKHLTKAEIAQRRASEVTAPSDNVCAPGYLNTAQKKAFKEMAQALIDIHIMTNLDCDALAAFIVHRDLWIESLTMLNNVLPTGDTHEVDVWQRAVSRNYKDMRSAASDLGLTISSRGKLQIPESAKPQPVVNKFAIFEGGVAK